VYKLIFHAFNFLFFLFERNFAKRTAKYRLKVHFLILKMSSSFLKIF